MPGATEKQLLSEDEYLAFENDSETRHELIDGQISAMTNPTLDHEQIAFNLIAPIMNHLKGKPCRVFGANTKIKRNEANFFYPDVLVDCNIDPNTTSSGAGISHNPTLIVEVLSNSTRRNDQTTKKMHYINMSTVEEYVLIEQHFAQVEVMRRSHNWESQKYFLGDSITFESIDLTIPVSEIYDKVNNEDMLTWLEQKSTDS